ncbi:MAG: bifunctional phosphoribosylaminoimidazolecarboxamide formyltransferase/IMP cyclohydrolase PurH [Proteobacteria bacterium]|nr:bifunctional phosphoribosylaminoimidazolecarboxamide formyltransferase/IMP cyclohydrolase PurH [Pseudomonadota bacterium]
MNSSRLPLQRALISVFDKTGLEPLCQKLSDHQIKIYSTGGTAKHIREMGFDVNQIESVTQFPEMMDGRVKTLHPKIFGGILARRDSKSDLLDCEAHDIPLFDLVVVNLYPFWDHLADSKEVQAKFIDIGGPSMMRAAAKNAASVTVLSSPEDYSHFLSEYDNHGGTTLNFRQTMAAMTFERTSRYDRMIANTWRTSAAALPSQIEFGSLTPLRYGENPHQTASWGASKQEWKILQGKELSYNNLLDSEAALRLNSEFAEPAVTIVKHNNPCGVASGENSVAELFKRSQSCDSKSAFGGIVAINREVDAEAAHGMAQLFLEVIVAPRFSKDAREILATKKNLRLIEWEKPVFNPFEVRTSLGGWLVQTTDPLGVTIDFKIVSQNQHLESSVQNDLKFAWRVCKHVRSNAIVIAKNGQTLGIGAGQMSRVDAVQIALEKAKGQTAGAVLASDAFFPFRDNIDLLKGSGIKAIIEPGGSQRDTEVIQACNEQNIVLLFTGKRHFRH